MAVLSLQFSVGSLVAAPIAREESARRAERLIAHMLHAGAVQVRKVVVIGVIEIQPIRDRDIDACRVVIQVHGEVGLIRQQFINRRHHRIGHRTRAALRPVRDDPRIGMARLEHHRRSATGVRLSRHPT